MLRLPIGYDNFYEIIHKKFDFVDKSLFIKEVFDDSAQVALILRPRRFGKTLNLSMLHCFLAAEVYKKSTVGLFDNLKIMDTGEEYLQHLGKYPVIFLTFKDIKSTSFTQAQEKLRELLIRTFDEHAYLANSERLSENQRQLFHAIYSNSANAAQFSNALYTLTECLATHHGINPWLLIDEYDSPIQSAYMNDYYPEMIELMRSVFSTALKTNPYLERAVITGILRIAKEDLFSGLNNLAVYSVLSSAYSQYFGFTEAEVTNLLEQNAWQDKADDIRRWYNGYQIGKTILYNPWSMVNYFREDGQLMPYWVNTSDNALIKRLLTHGSNQFKSDFETLLDDRVLNKPIDENMIFADLLSNTESPWSLLLMAGYLKVVAKEFTQDAIRCDLRIPNLEVNFLYRKIIKEWLANGHCISWYNAFLEHLLNGNIPLFERELREILVEIVSSHDTAKRSENFYHGLMLGLTASLRYDPDYELYSNKESGYGRYDYLIVSKKMDKPTLLLEFKKMDKPKNSDELEEKLEQTAQDALKQIYTNQYAADVKQRGISNLLCLAIAFCGRDFALASDHKLELYSN